MVGMATRWCGTLARGAWCSTEARRSCAWLWRWAMKAELRRERKAQRWWPSDGVLGAHGGTALGATAAPEGQRHGVAGRGWTRALRTEGGMVLAESGEGRGGAALVR